MSTLAIVLAAALVLTYAATFVGAPHAVFDFAVTLVIVLILLGVVG